MKTLKLSFDFSDHPKLVELLKIRSAAAGRSQKSILVDALNLYFSDLQEQELILSAARKTFAEWDNAEDEIYNEM